MNSLNIVSRLTTPPSRSRANSLAVQSGRGASAGDAPATGLDYLVEKLRSPAESPDEQQPGEKVPLLDDGHHEQKPGMRQTVLRIAHGIVFGITALFSAVATPVRRFLAWFYDEDGRLNVTFSAETPRLIVQGRRPKAAGRTTAMKTGSSAGRKASGDERHAAERSGSVDGAASTVTPGSEGDSIAGSKKESYPKESGLGETDMTGEGSRRERKFKSGRVKLLANEDGLRQRKEARARQKSRDFSPELKSPSSESKLSYPRAPASPRPLVPRRQPSYTLPLTNEVPTKTLIIDLDETLIHSMAKGGRMSTGHMVEVRLGGPVSGSGLQIGPGVPILYYVHERPGCHEFLRKACKWYKLVIFTASVQEYADPVIDWLERERKYFSGRYYRQHCTLRNGAYIKDVAQVEPDLSKVMILDNSPISYFFHEDNAIPIEGWISDPTDNDLSNLIPLLEGLQYTTDVRALLALRQGQSLPG
ncbi:hypothetical protein K470DRAFT_240029 [Piedraia hortae CBS 480.64]|uniref:FCP1 homology domain-containing protein n=1 Tax=Piedraia hortae CBS 480.64 TaxID=1314780 RepID=A0A6A7C952_9PEZI|nr:hypothetical protein K470DRAFT_240029 [Piedraia hortae CBS 480.64]